MIYKFAKFHLYIYYVEYISILFQIIFRILVKFINRFLYQIDLVSLKLNYFLLFYWFNLINIMSFKQN